MADLILAAELRVGDIIIDSTGNLDVEHLAVVNGGVRVFVTEAEAEFAQTWTFDPADLVRVVTRPGLPA